MTLNDSRCQLPVPEWASLAVVAAAVLAAMVVAADLLTTEPRYSNRGSGRPSEAAEATKGHIPPPWVDPNGRPGPC